MKTIKLNNKRLLLEFPTYREMNLSCFRITEFSEGPDSLRGRIFDMVEFIDAYAEVDGKLEYFYFWEGHNWSKKVFNEWFDINKNIYLSGRETTILSQINQVDEDGYIVSVVEGDKGTLRHELSHGLFFDNEEYRNSAIEILKELSPETHFKYKNCLINKNYNEAVILDEMHAYLAAWNEDEWVEQFSNISYAEIEDVQHELSNLFDKYNTIEI